MFGRSRFASGALLAFALGGMAAGCTTGGGVGNPKTGVPISASVLSDRQVTVASATAHREADQFAVSITSATATLGAGPVEDSNTGHKCMSDTVLLIKLIGDFNIVHGQTTTEPTDGDDDAVHAVSIIADPSTGDPCLISVQTGHPQPEPGSVVLFTG